MRRTIGFLMVAGLLAGCAPSVNVAQEKEALMRLDREWSASVKDTPKFLSFLAPDAAMYAPGMPVIAGAGPIKDAWTQMSSAPGFALEFAPTTADVGAGGDVGYTTGTYKSSMGGVAENGKYVTIWKKQPDGNWKVAHDIFNADTAGPPPSQHIAMAASSLAWGPPPPSLPPGATLAVVSGDPSKAGPFVIRAQMPAGYKILPHWHPGDENLTVLAGTIAVGMGDAWDEAKMQAFPVGGYVGLPAQMRHSFMTKTAATIQVHGNGPFVVNYVNPNDDPSKKK